MKILHEGEERVILLVERGPWKGMVLTVNEEDFRMKHIPGRKKSERKVFEYGDMLVVNDAIRKIYPELDKTTFGVIS